MTQKKLTITISEQLYYHLHSIIGKGKISKFIEKSVEHNVSKNMNLKVAYKEMAQDKQRELDADEWCENLIDNNDQN